MPLTVWISRRKRSAFGGGHEAIKNVRILADHKMRQELDRLAGRGQLVEGGKGDQGLVADAVDLHRDLGGKRFDQFAVQK